MSEKIVSAEHAVAAIGDRATVAVSGFRWAGSSEKVLKALAARYDQTGGPKALTLVFSSASGDNVSTGLEHLARPGLLGRVIGGFWGATPRIAKLASDGEIEAYNYPQGQIARLYAAIASGQPGLVSKIGLGSYIDPRYGGGRMTPSTTADLLEVVSLRGEEWLLYHAFPIHIALVRGTTADAHGNITMEDEAVTTEALPLAFAAHNSGGLVIAQVKRIAPRGSLHPRAVVIPGHVVNMVVVADDPAVDHRQCVASEFDPTLTGDARMADGPLLPETGTPALRRIIAGRAMQQLRAGDVANLGQGIPSEIAALVRSTALAGRVHFTIESGVNGGIPKPVPDFGIAQEPESILRQDDQFTFYDGGGLDIAFLGFAEIDAKGNVNVSKFGSRVVGCGGFLDIAQPAKRLVFCGGFTAGATDVVVEGGQLRIMRQGAGKKFVRTLQQVTFNAARARQQDQSVFLVTERCVFDVAPEGLRVIEVAPGIDLERDVIAHMEFRPIVAGTLRPMSLDT